MATKKATASAEKKATKTTKAPTKRAVEAKSEVAEAAAPPVPAAQEKRTPTYEEVAQLAVQFWIERGRPYGSPEVDWLRAEATLYA